MRSLVFRNECIYIHLNVGQAPLLKSLHIQQNIKSTDTSVHGIRIEGGMVCIPELREHECILIYLDVLNLALASIQVLTFP